MAQVDWEAVSPEVRVARLLLQREGLSPPVRVLDLLRKFASVESVTIPIDVDGVCYQHPDHRKPRVILNAANSNQNRERFTAAHELGHIVLPWQAGTILCHPNEQLSSALDARYRKIEDEANQFARELLVPAPWLKSQLAGRTDELAQKVYTIAELAEVSPMVAAFAVSEVFGTAKFFFTRGEATEMSVSGTVLGRWSRLEWRPELAAEYERHGGRYSRKDYGPYTLHCFEFVDDVGEPPAEPSTQILAQILDARSLTPTARKRLEGIVNGIIGSANSRTTARSATEFLPALRYRFADRPPELSPVVDDPRFHEFMRAKAHELAAKRGRLGGRSKRR
jgi:hypothetical protein